MSVTHIKDFFAHPCAIGEHEYAATLAMIAPCLKAGRPDLADELLAREPLTARCTVIGGGGEYAEVAEAPAGSVAVLSLRGFLLASETDRLIELVGLIEQNPNIIGTVLDIDGPGGHATHVDLATAALHQCSKPVAALVSGDALSGHYWLASATDRIIVMSPMGRLGSIGAFTTYVNTRGMFEQMGIDMRDIYPDTSDLKNEEFRAISERDDEGPVKQRLARLHAYFANDVAQGRGLEYDPEAEYFRGRVYDAAEAISTGLADSMGTMADAVAWVHTEATLRQVNEYYG